jgi:hypothetical protein
MLWALSVCSLALAMNDNLAADKSAEALPLHNAAPYVTHLRAGAVFFAFGCTLLQLGTGLLATFVLRASWCLRAAACYAVGVCSIILADAFALFGLLVWMRWNEPL